MALYLDNIFNPLPPPPGLWVSDYHRPEKPGVEYAYRAAVSACGEGLFWHVFEITKTTPKGFWIEEYGRPKFVRGRYAHRRKDDALRCLIWRRRCYVKILEKELRVTNKFLKLAETSLNSISATAELHNTNT